MYHTNDILQHHFWKGGCSRRDIWNLTTLISLNCGTQQNRLHQATTPIHLWNCESCQAQCTSSIPCQICTSQQHPSNLPTNRTSEDLRLVQRRATVSEVGVYEGRQHQQVWSKGVASKLTALKEPIVLKGATSHWSRCLPWSLKRTKWESSEKTSPSSSSPIEIGAHDAHVGNCFNIFEVPWSPWGTGLEWYHSLDWQAASGNQHQCSYQNPNSSLAAGKCLKSWEACSSTTDEFPANHTRHQAKR